MRQGSSDEEKILVGKLLSLVSQSVTTSLEKFSGWLLAGVGAGFALILSNIDAIREFIYIESIKLAVYIYLAALALGILQRWLAAGINGASLVAKESEDLGRNAADSVNFDNVLTEIERATLYPQKWLVRYQFNKVRSGDFAIAGRMQAIMAQVQGFFVLGQGILVIAAIIIMVSDLNA